MSLAAIGRLRIAVNTERAPQRRTIDIAASAIMTAAVLGLCTFWGGVLLLLAR